MPLRKDLHVQLEGQCLAGGFGLELTGELLRHLDILEHHLQLLSELKAAFLFELEDQGSFSILVVVSVVQEPFSKAVFVESFENVLVEKIPEDVNDFVQDLVQLDFLDRFEVLLEHFVEVKHECLGSPVVLVDNVFEGEFDAKLDLGVLFHGFDCNLHDAIP